LMDSVQSIMRVLLRSADEAIYFTIVPCNVYFSILLVSLYKGWIGPRTGRSKNKD
jgi:hypothetical protein